MKNYKIYEQTKLLLLSYFRVSTLTRLGQSGVIAKKAFVGVTNPNFANSHVKVVFLIN